MSGRKVVLIAEDERAIAEIVRVVVEDAGYRPVLAAHGRQALDMARIEHPALVVTDLMMPHMTGAELIAALRADAAPDGGVRAPVILMTAVNPSQARAAGADAVLYKPFDLDALEALLRRFLDDSALTPDP
ncbi:MAG: response regulator [Chloroflexi bacterium]|nr:response regulator [Chloroflexota bacterium]